ncbi:MAG TPA: hypothetical protein DEB06_08125 [Phycisphaerales bacterium]|nr:hypothetical protein [Phycisphaerales bacterium]
MRRCESVRYSAFGVPTVIASGDFDGDGDEDSADSDFMLNLLAQNPVPYSVVADMDLDGDTDLDDDALQLLTSGGGRGLLSTSGVGNRSGYAGYEHDWAIDSLCHVRHRAYLTDLGRWTRRDPLGYVEGMSLYAYVANRAVVRTDPMGLYSEEPQMPRPGSKEGRRPKTTDGEIDEEPGGGGCAPGAPCLSVYCTMERKPSYLLLPCLRFGNEWVNVKITTSCPGSEEPYEESFCAKCLGDCPQGGTCSLKSYSVTLPDGCHQTGKKCECPAQVQRQ